jgi:ankyrin repeat protein
MKFKKLYIKENFVMIYNYNRFVKLNENIDWNQKLLDYSWSGDLKGVKECLENGADVNCKDKWGQTPLMESSYYGYLEIVKVLIENGVDVNCKNDNGDTPLMNSSHMNHLEIVKVLIENGADWNIKDDDNWDFMDYLSKENEEIIIKKYPEEYELYKLKKDVEKYNL